MMLSLSAVGGAAFVAPMPTLAAVAQDQVITVKGQVVDDQGEPLIGATVKTKDGKTGAVTDLDGNFEIKVKANSTLTVSLPWIQGARDCSAWTCHSRQDRDVFQ